MPFHPRRPQYSERQGQAKDGQYFNFVVVFTPHIRRRILNRARVTAEGFLSHYEIDLSELWVFLEEDECHYVKVGSQFFLYCKRLYNKKRNRWEMELITLTPSNHAHTNTLTFAKPVLSKRQNLSRMLFSPLFN